MCDPASETNKVREALVERSDRGRAIWWLARLTQTVIDGGVDEPTLRITVIPAVRNILEGLQ